MVGSDAPALTASYGAPAPPELLLQHVRAFLGRDHASEQALTELVTGTVVDLGSEGGNLTQVEGTTYELLLLACGVQHGRRVAGVIALDAAEHGTMFATQARLLATLAEHLVRGAGRERLLRT